MGSGYHVTEDEDGYMIIREDLSQVAWRQLVHSVGMNPSELQGQLARENTQPGPYSWDLVCKIAQFEKGLLNHLEILRGTPAGEKMRAEMYDSWFNEEHGKVGRLIRKEKMTGVEPPHKERPKPKGFWESLFG